jgi:putative membrane protein
MLRRWAIRLAGSLIGIAAGLLLCSGLLTKFSISATALVEATLLFWVVHIVVQFLALKVLVRQPSVALAGLLALASTIIALIIVALIIEGLSVHGAATYVGATVIIWATTAAGDIVARRMIRERRAARDAR